VHLGDVAPVVVISDEGAAQQRRLLFNPRVLAVADLHEKGEEGSVSLPGVRVEISRPVWADIAFMDVAGAPAQQRVEGFAARVALHEIDQMQGIFFLDRVSRLKRDMALKKARKATG
jgi:peptide deformylase